MQVLLSDIQRRRSQVVGLLTENDYINKTLGPVCGRCLPSWTIYMELLMSERQNPCCLMFPLRRHHQRTGEQRRRSSSCSWRLLKYPGKWFIRLPSARRHRSQPFISSWRWPCAAGASTPTHTFFSCPPVVSAWMMLCIDSFVHSCRRICTCNRSPVDIGLITALSWHPAASPSSHEPGRPADAAASASKRAPPPVATRAEEKDGC